MKRTLLLASFLGLLGFALYAQNAGSAAKGAVNGNQATGAQAANSGQAAGAVNKPNALPRSRSPNAQVTVTPGPQGLPIVNSSASAWPLGPALGEDLNFWLNGIPQTVENNGESQSPPPAAQNSRSRPAGQPKPSFEPPPMGGLPSLGAPRPGGRSSASMDPDLVSPDPRIQKEPQISPAPEEVPAGAAPQALLQNDAPPQVDGEAPAPAAVRPQNNRPGAQVSQAPKQDNRQTPPAQSTPPAPSGARSTASTKKVVVVPSPVHYDRAGRRVIDPSWQETMYRMIQAEKEAASPAQTPARTEAAQGGTEQAGTDQAVEQGETQDAEAAGNVPAVRETVIVVPGPTVWRIRGILTVAKGMLALEDDDGVLWYLPGLDRYIGFIDGLIAGEEAALEGYAPPRGSSQERYFQPIRFFVDEMVYDLSTPPYGIAAEPYLTNPGGQTTVIREIERPAVNMGATGKRGESRSRGGRYDDAWDDPDDWDNPDDWDDRDDDPAAWGRDEDRRETPRDRPASGAQPAWQHSHKSPWAPPASVLDFEMDYDSFWQRDRAKERRRERDSREIWY